MTGLRFLMMAIALAATPMGGCMLPQPDTPIIPPHQQASDLVKAQPQEGVSQPTTLTPTAPPSSPDAADALLSGAIVGDAASALQAVPEGESGQAVRVELGADRSFALSLRPGTYRLEVVVDDRVAIVEERLTVTAGETREAILHVSRDPLAATLEAPPAEPASPEASATDS